MEQNLKITFQRFYEKIFQDFQRLIPSNLSAVGGNLPHSQITAALDAVEGQPGLNRGGIVQAHGAAHVNPPVHSAFSSKNPTYFSYVPGKKGKKTFFRQQPKNSRLKSQELLVSSLCVRKQIPERLLDRPLKISDSKKLHDSKKNLKKKV
jgi:hypothetical protein